MTTTDASALISELKSFPFFQNFPDVLLNSLVRIGVLKVYPPGALLLEQGKSNKRLFFLRSGELAVELDGEVVSVLSVAGEVIGEMSLINDLPVTASVRARLEAHVFELGDEYLRRLPQDEYKTFQMLLKDFYAPLLTERLTKTNDKARRFEIANRELQAAQLKLQKLNENLEAEIARRSKELVTKVKELTGSHLEPAQKILMSHAMSENQNFAMTEVRSLLGLVTETIDFLKPVAELSDRKAQSGPRRVLLCDSSKKQQTVAKLALGGTGVELTIASSAEEFKMLALEGSFDLVLCDAKLGELAQAVRNSSKKTPLVMLVDLDLQQYLQTLNDFASDGFFVSRDENNRIFTIKNISTTVAKILNEDFFGLEKYLAWSSKIIQVPVKQSDERQVLIDEMREYFQSFGLRSSILDQVAQVTEELLMNAIYDAPCDSAGKPLYNHLPRTQKVTLSPEHYGQLRYGTDGVLLGVSVSDPFGALTRQTIKNYLQSAQAGVDVNSAEKGGAGKGLHIVISSSDLTVFNVKSKQKTEVLCLFNLEKSKDAEPQPPTFHLFIS